MSKNETLQLKGIALIIMFCHHLFGCGTFLMLKDNEWIPCFGKYDYIFSSGFKICIGLFAAVSGYGLYKSYIIKDNYSALVGRIATFLITYLTILFGVAIPYLIFFQKFDSRYLFLNIFALLHNDKMLYLSFSWYVKVYLELLFILPIIKLLNSKIKILHTINEQI